MKPATLIFTAFSLGPLICATSTHATLSDYQAAVTNEPSLISYYTFDQANANDNRGLHHGTVQGGATFRTGISSAGQGLRLDGTGRVNLGTVADFNFSDTTGSVESWVRVDWSGTFGGYNPCLFANRNGGPVTWSVHMNGDKSGVGMWNGAAYFPTLTIPAPGTNWHHVVVVFEAGYLTIYWDGAPLGTVVRALGASPSSTQIGSSSANVTAEGWMGMFDEVAFYSDALSETSVQAHYAAFFAGSPPVILSQPRGGNYLPGVALRLTVGATGPNLTYQWYKNGGAIAGATEATLLLPSLAQSDAGTYRVVVHNPAADVSSADAIVSVTAALPAPLVQYQTAVIAQPGLVSHYAFDRLNADTTVGAYHGTLMGTAGFDEGVGGGPDQALRLDGAGFVGLGIVPELDFADGTGSAEAWVRLDWPATFGSYNPCLLANRDSGQVAWSIHVNSDKRALGVWNGSSYQYLPMPAPGTDWHHVAVVFDTGTNTIYWDGLALGSFEQPVGTFSASTQLGSSSSFSAAEGWIGGIDEVTFFADALSGTAVAAHYKALAGSARPVITLQPAGGAFYTGQSLELRVGAIGAERTYQWFKNGTPIPGATNWALAIPNAVPTDSGSYYVSISNPAGTTNSVEVTVFVGNNLVAYRGAVTNEADLISYYSFDADDAHDSKGTNHGTVINTVVFGPGIGMDNDHALVLDGTAHVALGQVAAFDFADGNGTVEAWIRPEWSAPGYAPCVFANRIASTYQVNWSIHMVQNRDAIGNWNGLFFQTLGLPYAAGWHHYAVTFGGDRVFMYWDGLPAGSFAQPIKLTTGLPTQIGSSDPATTTEAWIGGIDEMAFYRAPLSAEKILSHFMAMAGAPTAAPAITISRSGTQLVLSWPDWAMGYTLETSDSLHGILWTPVSGVVGNNVTVDASSGTRFYRLKK